MLFVAWLPVILTNQKSVFAQLATTGWFVARQGLNLGGKTRNIALLLVLQQCCKTSCRFLLPVFPQLKSCLHNATHVCLALQERRKKAIALDWQNQLCACISLPSLHDYERENAYFFFTFCGGREHTVLFLNFDTVYTVFQKSTPDKKIANSWRIKGDRISAIKFQAARLHFLSEVFVAVAVDVASSLISQCKYRGRFQATNKG